MSFTVGDFNFIKSKDSVIFCIFSDDYIRTYKLKLKLFIKNSFIGLTNLYFLKQVNKLIFYWSVTYNYVNCFFDIWSNLDLYIYKLLWNCVRRRHPRRPNTWIYAKYWRFFNGFCKFYFLNSRTGGFWILRSHFYLEVDVSRFPLSSNYFSFLDEKKLKFFCFNRFKYSFIGLFKYLWFKQKGVCFVCKRIFNFVNFRSVRVMNFTSMKNKPSCFFLVHSSCF